MNKPDDPSHRGINFNSVLLSIVLGLSGWTLLEVNSQGKDFAVLRETVGNALRELAELRSKHTIMENRLVLLQIDLAKIEQNQREIRKDK